MQAYRRLAGEVEARNTQARANLTDAERNATSPQSTADVADRDQIVTFAKGLAQMAEPAAREILLLDAAEFRVVPATRAQWHADFPDGLAHTPIGAVKLGDNQFEKLVSRDAGSRSQFVGLVKPTLETPAFVVRNATGATLYIKAFRKDDGKVRGFASVSVGIDGVDVVISNIPKDIGWLVREINSGVLLYPAKPVGNSELNATTSPEQQDPIAGGLDASLGQDEKLFQPDGGPGPVKRGSFSPATNTITLLKNADLSTFLHESAHFPPQPSPFVP